MDRYQIYLLLHFAGILMVFLAFGSLVARAALQPDNRSWRKFGAITSGIGLFLILLGGFGMLARLNLGYPGWAIIKTVIWVALGAMTALINQKPRAAKPLWWITLVLGVLAVLTVIIKPLSDVGIKPHRPEPVEQVRDAIDDAGEAIRDATN